MMVTVSELLSVPVYDPGVSANEANDCPAQFKLPVKDVPAEKAGGRPSRATLINTDVFNPETEVALATVDDVPKTGKEFAGTKKYSFKLTVVPDGSVVESKYGRLLSMRFPKTALKGPLVVGSAVNDPDKVATTLAPLSSNMITRPAVAEDAGVTAAARKRTNAERAKNVFMSKLQSQIRKLWKRVDDLHELAPYAVERRM